MAADPTPVWAILATDGRHALMGRYSTPTEEEVGRAAALIAKQGLRAWLVRMHGDRFAQMPPRIIRERALHEGLDDADFAAALEAFVALHRQRIARS